MLISAAEHVAAVEVIVGTAGVANIAAFVNVALAADVQVPIPEVTVYGVPSIIPVIKPPAPTVGPDGVKV